MSMTTMTVLLSPQMTLLVPNNHLPAFNCNIENSALAVLSKEKNPNFKRSFLSCPASCPPATKISRKSPEKSSGHGEPSRNQLSYQPVTWSTKFPTRLPHCTSNIMSSIALRSFHEKVGDAKKVRRIITSRNAASALPVGLADSSIPWSLEMLDYKASGASSSTLLVTLWDTCQVHVLFDGQHQHIHFRYKLPLYSRPMCCCCQCLLPKNVCLWAKNLGLGV